MCVCKFIVTTIKYLYSYWLIISLSDIKNQYNILFPNYQLQLAITCNIWLTII